MEKIREKDVNQQVLEEQIAKENWKKVSELVGEMTKQQKQAYFCGNESDYNVFCKLDFERQKQLLLEEAILEEVFIAYFKYDTDAQKGSGKLLKSVKPIFSGLAGIAFEIFAKEETLNQYYSSFKSIEERRYVLELLIRLKPNLARQLLIERADKLDFWEEMALRVLREENDNFE